MLEKIIAMAQAGVWRKIYQSIWFRWGFGSIAVNSLLFAALLIPKRMFPDVLSLLYIHWVPFFLIIPHDKWNGDKYMVYLVPYNFILGIFLGFVLMKLANIKYRPFPSILPTSKSKDLHDKKRICL